MTRLLLADVGDLDVTAAVPALAGRHAAAVVTLTLDVGQRGGTASSRARALAAGAVRAHVMDAREEFAREYLLPVLRAGVLRADDLARPRALLRTLVAAKLLEVAAMEGITHVAHGWAPGTSGADHLVRTIARQKPDAVVIAAGVPPAPAFDPPPDASRRACVESTLWWRRLACAGDAAAGPGAPGAEAAAVLEVTFMEGFPVALNGIEMPLVELIEAADTIAGDHGVGRSVIRNEDGGATMIDAPAAAALIAAHGAITRASGSPLLQRLRRQVAGRYAAVLDAGEWMSDARPALDAFVAEAQKRASGTVRLRLRRGRCRVEGGHPSDALTPGRAPQLEPSGSAADAAPGAPLNLVVSH